MFKFKLFNMGKYLKSNLKRINELQNKPKVEIPNN